MTVAVTGASGWLGGLIGQMLVDELGGDQVVLLTRSPEKVSEQLRESGADVRAAGFDDITPAAFDGVERVFVVSSDHWNTPRRVEQHRRVFESAREAGTRHVVFSSMPKVDDNHPTGDYAREYPASEQVLKESGLDWTVLQVGPYAEGLVPRAAIAVRTGKWTSNAGEGRTAPLAHADAARTAVATVTKDGVEGKTYIATGTKLFSQPELAQMIAEITGKPVEHTPISDEDHPALLREVGIPEPFDLYLPRHLAAIRMGYFDSLTDHVEELTGRPPEPLRTVLERNRDEMLGGAG